MRELFFTAAVLVAVLALPAMAGEETGTPTGEAAAPVIPARGQVKEIEPGHWVAHLRDDRFIDLIAPKGNERVWAVVGPDGKPQSVEEKSEPGASEDVRRFQVGFQYVGSDGGEVTALVTGAIVDREGGPVRVLHFFDLPGQKLKIVYVKVPVPGPVVVKKKRSSNTGAIAGGVLGLLGIAALISKGGDGGGKPNPDGRLEKYCPYWRQHVADDHAAGRNTGRGDYTYDGATWEEVDRKLQEHLRTCPYAIAGGFDPQDGGPGVGDSLIQARNGEPELGISLDRLGFSHARLSATAQGLNLQAHLRGGLRLSIAQDRSWGIGTDKLRFTAGAGAEKNFEIAAKLSGVNLRLSNFGGDWIGGVSGSLSF